MATISVRSIVGFAAYPPVTSTPMDVRYPPEAESYREKVQAFLAEHLPANWKGIGALAHDEAAAFTEEWRRTLYEHGYLAVGWPKEYGGQALSALEQVILAEEFTKAGVPAGLGPLAPLAGAAALAHLRL